MNRLDRKQYILIVTDSRGAWLHRELNRYQSYRLKFSVIYRKGAGLEELWEVIEWNLLTKHIDYVFLLGGICNLTEKCHVRGHREFWPPSDLDLSFGRVHQLIRDMAKNFKLLKTNSKLVLLPEPGIDLIRYNGVPHPVPWRKLVVQSEFEDRLELLHLYTRAINSHLGVTTPWSLDITHTHRNHEVHPVYDRLRDGLHFTGSQVTKLAKILAEYVEDDITKSMSNYTLVFIHFMPYCYSSGINVISYLVTDTELEPRLYQINGDKQVFLFQKCNSTIKTLLGSCRPQFLNISSDDQPSLWHRATDLYALLLTDCIIIMLLYLYF